MIRRRIIGIFICLLMQSAGIVVASLDKDQQQQKAAADSLSSNRGATQLARTRLQMTNPVQASKEEWRYAKKKAQDVIDSNEKLIASADRQVMELSQLMEDHKELVSMFVAARLQRNEAAFSYHTNFLPSVSLNRLLENDAAVFR